MGGFMQLLIFYVTDLIRPFKRDFKMSVLINLIGKVSGRLIVLERHPENTKKKGSRWKCLCDPKLGGCGKTTIVSSWVIRHQTTRSCGCLLIERNKTYRTITHGLSYSREYQVWKDIKKRCYNENDKYYADYGGRGITMCDEWKDDFAAFYRDMGPRPSSDYSIDRKDNDKGYSKDNCHWATRIEQANNMRKNIFYTYNGKSRTLAGWCREYELNYQTSYARLQSGWSIDQIITGMCG